jgi:FkbM family methyltransferase
MFDETTSQIEIAGSCKQGDGPSFPIVRESAERPAVMHCVEPIPSTVKQLQASVTELGLDGAHTSSLQKFIVSPCAISEQDSSGILFPSKVPTGVENLSLAACDTSPEEQERYGCQEVPVYSLNTYGERFLSDELRDPTQNIQILNIDAEGYDFNIMKGGKDVLKRTEYLEFEVHLRKPWRHQSLKEAVDMLDNIGFSCYWAGHGSLWRLNGDGCFLDHYEDKCWSNVACANRRLASELTEIMEEIFIETLNMNGRNDEAWLRTS